MKKLNLFILEKLKLNNNQPKYFNDEILRNDYNEVSGAYTKAEKQEYCKKYGINSNKIREIQIEILDLLRQNRHNKKEYDNDDVIDFIRYDIPEKKYFDYLEEEPIDFVYTIYKYYKEKCEKNKLLQYQYLVKSRNIGYRISIADQNLLKKYIKLRDFLKDKNYSDEELK